MSYNKTPYAPNFPPNQSYDQQPKAPEEHPLVPQVGYPGPPPGPMNMPVPMPQPYQPAMQYIPLNPNYNAPLQAHQAVTQQPVPIGNPGGWMSIPQGISNCPPGLEYLSMIDHLLVEQKVELLETFIGYETNNKYIISNKIGQNVYFAAEENDCCTRQFCGPMRPFDLKILDHFKNEVIHINRPLACDSCCCPCWLQSIEVTAPPGTIIGTVEQEWSIFTPSYSIKDATGNVVLKIEGPCCTFSCCDDVEFDVLSKDGKVKVGKITKKWTGLTREAFTDADNFGISFPMDLDVRIKAVLLGACFLIDYMFFEKTGRR